MSRLLKLKEWLTVDDAARQLSTMLSEPVGRADLLRLALDGHLKLSVHLVNTAKARRGVLKPNADATYFELSPEAAAALDVPEEHRGKPITMLEGIQFNDDEVLELSSDVVKLSGVYDLALVGGERHDVEHEYQRLTDGPEVTLHSLEGTFVLGAQPGEVFQLLDRLTEDDRIDAESTLTAAATVSGVSPSELDRMRLLFQERRRRAANRPAARAERDDYIPAAGLPRDGVLVVRTSALVNLHALAVDEEPGKAEDKPLSPRERGTYLNIVGGLLGLMLGKTPQGKALSVFASQATVIDALLAHHGDKPGISRTTLEAKFAEAKRKLEAS